MNKEQAKYIKELFEYMGDRFDLDVLTISEDDWNMYEKAKVDITKSYFVTGDRDKLRKFEILFMGSHNYDKPMHKFFNIKEYVEGISRKISEDTINEYDAELLFLYIHKELLGVGNTENWVFSSVIEKAAERNILGRVTIVLSERKLPEFEKCGEFKVAHLGGAVTKKTIQEIVNKSKETANEDTVVPEEYKAPTDRDVSF